MWAGLLALFPGVSQAAMFMLVEGVTGPSKMPNYVGWFIVDNASWSIDRAKVAEPHSLIVALRSSAGTAALIQLSASGVPLKRIALDHVSVAEGTATLIMERLACEDPIIRSSGVSADADDFAQVQLKIRCGRLAWENFDYNSQKKVAAAGKGSWNFKTNSP